MGMAGPSVVVLVVGSAAIAVAVGVVALRQRPDPIAWPLSLLMFSVAAWTIPHAISLLSPDLSQAALWHRFRYPGVAVTPVAYLLVALRYAGYEQWLSRRVYAALFVIPVVTTLIVWTNPLHGLYWESLTAMRTGGVSVPVETFGPWRPVLLAYLYIVTGASLLIYGAKMLRAEPIYRKQALTIFVGGLMPLAANIAEELGLLTGLRVDFTALALSVTGLTFALALFHLDLLEIQPIARARLIDELDDGVVVIGPEGRIRDFNPTAARILGDIAVEQPADEVLSSDITADGGELVVETTSGERRFRSRSTPLTDERGQHVGRIIYFNDVTELIEREQRVSVLNRILRHNVRNELNVATGHLEMADLDGSGDEEHISTAKESVQQVIEFAEKARHVEQTLRQKDTTTSVSAANIINRVIADARERYDDAVIEYDPVDGTEGAACIDVVDADLFEMAIAELVENAIVHNDRDSSRVVVAIEPDSEHVRIEITDNGPGIPDHEQDVLFSQSETRLQHGSGLGLWLVNWVTSLSSGTLSFTENDPRGTTIVLSLPATSA